MRPASSSRLRITALLSVLALAATTLLGATDPDPRLEGLGELPDLLDYGIQGEGPDRVQDLDARGGSVAPTSAQRELAASLGATVRWNAFGTPQVLLAADAPFSEASDAEPVDVARAFVDRHRALFRLSADAVAALAVERESPLYDAPDLVRVYRDGAEPANPDIATVVTFRQRFGDLPTVEDGLLTVGVDRHGQVVWVSSSATGDEQVSGEVVLDPVTAVRTAADDAGLDHLGALTLLDDLGTRGEKLLRAAGVHDPQRARLAALPTPTDGVRLVWEVTLLDTELHAHSHATPHAFESYLDAATGEVLLRRNRVDHLAEGAATAVTAFDDPLGLGLPVTLPDTFEGSTTPAGCGPKHGPFDAPEGTAQITVAVATLVPDGLDDDITVQLFAADDPDVVVADQDLLTSPEVLTYAPSGGVPAGGYLVQVCPYTATAGPIAYAGVFAASELGGGGGATFRDPTWRVFPTNPNFVTSPDASADVRELWCWLGDDPSCTDAQANLASRLPWDANALGGLPSFTTDGNNASTAISNASFLTPDTIVQRPVSPTREYDFVWEDRWNRSGCDPSAFVTGNDEDASVTNLFVMHNRMHDWSYHLGFTEVNANLQKHNFGNTGPERENDPEIGQAQAGRLTFNGRDNANQITLPDGIPGITNQYLWQPLAGAFYGTCTDGAYDMAIVAHEYAHAISGRMTAGPDTTLGATQGQTESWSDLAFAEYFRGFSLVASPDANPYALAPYTTGNLERGIRNYAMNDSPLNYSNLDYDGNGTTSPHADGEIWSAVNFDISELLNRDHDARFPSGDAALQRSCALGERPADVCPGNRRWAQLMFDGLLLQPASPSMVDSRDAMLAADLLRFDGENQATLWDGFAARGLGETASTTGASDRMPTPGWTSPLRDDHGTVTFTAADTGSGTPEVFEVYVGDYEARMTPVADTDPETERGDTERFAPGTYRGVLRADGFGTTRFRFTVEPGERTVAVPVRRNLASASNGATASGDGVNLEALIDDTEGTNWASLSSEGTASEGLGEGRQVEGRQVTVHLGDAPTAVTEVAVSAALRPTDGDDEGGDTGSQSRFSALRSFEILTCDASVTGGCEDEGDFDLVLTSPDDAFPGTRPRPTVSDLSLRRFELTPSEATHVRLRVLTSQCTGGPEYQREANPTNDPLFDPDCDTEDPSPDRAVLSPPVHEVRAAELQVFGPATLDPSTPGEDDGVGPGAPGGGTPGGGTPGDGRPGQPGGPRDGCFERGPSFDDDPRSLVTCLVELGLVQGFPDGTFRPALAVSRRHQVAVLVRYLDAIDALEGDRSDDPAQRLVDAGILRGDEDGDLKLGAPISRGQFVSLLARSLDHAGLDLPEDGPRFEDSGDGVHDRPARRVAAAGLLSGYPDGTARLNQQISRRQMATVLWRSVEHAREDRPGAFPED
jgi:extracellular elastinolytic metalloproteinase